MNLFVYICLKCKVIYNDRNDRLVVAWEEGGAEKDLQKSIRILGADRSVHYLIMATVFMGVFIC